MSSYKEKAGEITVVGHKNPDTDSICSAICYANLKNILSGENSYKARRAGHLNEETHFVLDRWKVHVPEYIKDVRPQVRDIEIRKTQGISEELSIREAYKLMKQLDVVTLPITDGKQLLGVITIGDIAQSYFELFDNKVLATAHTSYKNIIGTVEGRNITGDTEGYCEGKMLIAAGNPDVLENVMDPGDTVILGNRYESQLLAIEMEARCIIVCEGAKVPNTIQKIASQHNCLMVETDYDTYTVARLINQSIPVRFIMRSRENLICFRTDDYTEDIQDVMAKQRFRDFPIEDENGEYVGLISRRNLLGAGRKKVILVDHNEKNQAVNGIENAEILEIIDHHRLGAIQTISPVFFRNQPLGCTGTIIYKMYRENGIDIDHTMAALMCSAIISDTLILKSPTCTADDVEACEALAAIAGIDIATYGREMFRAGSNLSEKSAEEIFYQDFKKFSINDVVIGVCQVNIMSREEADDISERLENYMAEVTINAGLDLAYCMITDVLEESSYVLCAGKNAGMALDHSFNNIVKKGDTYLLKGVVSRKKQFLPAIMEYMQQ